MKDDERNKKKFPTTTLIEIFKDKCLAADESKVEEKLKNAKKTFFLPFAHFNRFKTRKLAAQSFVVSLSNEKV